MHNPVGAYGLRAFSPSPRSAEGAWPRRWCGSACTTTPAWASACATSPTTLQCAGASPTSVVFFGNTSRLHRLPVQSRNHQEVFFKGRLNTETKEGMFVCLIGIFFAACGDPIIVLGLIRTYVPFIPSTLPSWSPLPAEARPEGGGVAFAGVLVG